MRITQTPPLILLAKWHARVPMAKNEIAACMGIDRETVTRIERSAMQKIRAELVRVMQLNSEDRNENKSHQSRPATAKAQEVQTPKAPYGPSSE